MKVSESTTNSSLDDFFAKKDKNKKSKNKCIINGNEEMVHKLEKNSKRSEKSRKSHKENASDTSARNPNTNISEQIVEEWHDFEEEPEKDYSGLRIQTLNIKDKAEELRDQQRMDFEDRNREEMKSGPWNKCNHCSSGSNASEVAVERSSDDTLNGAISGGSVGGESQKGKYLPPHLRNERSSDDTLNGAISGGSVGGPVGGESQKGKYLPPHLRNERSSDDTLNGAISGGSVGGPVGGESQKGKYLPPHLRNERSSDDTLNGAISGGSVGGPVGGESQTGKYLPPHLRNESSTHSSNPSKRTHLKKWKSGAPKICDITEFPSLGTALESSDDIKGFQTVNNRNIEADHKSSSHLALKNKFGLLYQ